MQIEVAIIFTDSVNIMCKCVVTTTFLGVTTCRKHEIECYKEFYEVNIVIQVP